MMLFGVRVPSLITDYDVVWCQGTLTCYRLWCCLVSGYLHLLQIMMLFGVRVPSLVTDYDVVWYWGTLTCDRLWCRLVLWYLNYQLWCLVLRCFNYRLWCCLVLGYFNFRCIMYFECVNNDIIIIIINYRLFGVSLPATDYDVFWCQNTLTCYGLFVAKFDGGAHYHQWSLVISDCIIGRHLHV